MKTRPLSVPAVLLSLLLVIASMPAQAEVPASVTEQLKRGINLSFWFTYRSDPSIDPKLWAPDAEDLRNLKRMGFRHVRVPFDRAWLVDPQDPKRLQPQRLEQFAKALEQVSANGLLAVITLNADNDYLKRLLSDPATLTAASGFWWNLAKSLSARLPPDRLVFEVLNEPGTDDAAASLKVMQTLAGAVRDAAPSHTIVVAGHKYSSVDELVALTPFQDHNLVYTFHFYEPFNFTHQGARWGWPTWALFHDFPYPSSPEALAPVLGGLDPTARPHAEYYGQQRWNRDKLATILDKVAAWQTANKVPVWCGEFGALKTVAPRGSREAWLRDARELMEARGIAWAHFDFTQHFGLVDGPQGARLWNADAVRALGLSVTTAER